MAETSSSFVGDIPRNYDEGLGPVIFDGYAEDIAARAAALNPSRVLELAAGTGIVSRKLKDALWDAELIVTDLNPPMLDVARMKFRDDEDVVIAPADAMALDFPDAHFDLIVCQFGVMFFPDKVTAFREARRVLRSGGTYLFNVWGSMEENPFSQLTQEISDQFFPDDGPQFYRVPFSYPNPDTVIADIRASGLIDVAYEELPFDRHINSWSDFAQGLVFGNPLIDEIKSRGNVDPEDVKGAVETKLRETWGSEPATLPIIARVFTARAP